MKKLLLIPTTLIVGLAPAISLVGCGGDTPEPPTPTGDYLSITSDKESTIQILVDNNGEFATRLPNISYWDDETWHECEFLTTGNDEYTSEIPITAEDNYTIYLKGNNPDGLSIDVDHYNHSYVEIDCLEFNNGENSAQWTLGGSVMGLIDNGDISRRGTIPNKACFEDLFGYNENIVYVDRNLLPATSLKEYCYSSMFWGCENLKNVPDLPALSVPDYGYDCMFRDCPNLQNGPSELKATTLGQSSYGGMFYECTSLKTPAKIYAETMGFGACNSMYEGCSTLNMPSNYTLPTNISEECFSKMFCGCISLTRTCELTTANLANKCYDSMFKDCPNLQTIKPITVADNDIVGVESAFDSMFAMSEEVEAKTPSAYSLNKSIVSSSPTIDLSNCTTDEGCNFVDMFAGRQLVQQPELRETYTFIKNENFIALDLYYKEFINSCDLRSNETFYPKYEETYYFAIDTSVWAGSKDAADYTYGGFTMETANNERIVIDDFKILLDGVPLDEQYIDHSSPDDVQFTSEGIDLILNATEAIGRVTVTDFEIWLFGSTESHFHFRAWMSHS